MKVKQTKILIVDDSKVFAESLAHILRLEGCRPTYVLSGEEAVEKVKEHSYDGILMDIRMPRISGVDAFREIKKTRPHMPVIFMTAYSTSELVREARREGAIEVLVKPFDIEQAVKLVIEAAKTHPVLIADDDKEFCSYLKDILERESFSVRMAHTAQEAISLYEREPAEIVLLDVKLNVMNGDEVLVIIKGINPKVIAILMTSYRGAMKEEVEKAPELSAYAYLYKPFSPEELFQTLEHALGDKLKRGESGNSASRKSF